MTLNPNLPSPREILRSVLKNKKNLTPEELERATDVLLYASLRWALNDGILLGGKFSELFYEEENDNTGEITLPNLDYEEQNVIPERIEDLRVNGELN